MSYCALRQSYCTFLQAATNSKVFNSSIYKRTSFGTSSPVSMPTFVVSLIQIAMSLEETEVSGSPRFLYGSCSVDYNIVCNGGGDQMEQNSFAGVKYLEACYSKPQYPDVPLIKASGIVTDQSHAFSALVKPVVFEQKQKDWKKSILSLLNPLLTRMHLISMTPVKICATLWTVLELLINLCPLFVKMMSNEKALFKHR